MPTLTADSQSVADAFASHHQITRSRTAHSEQDPPVQSRCCNPNFLVLVDATARLGGSRSDLALNYGHNEILHGESVVARISCLLAEHF